LVYPGGVEFTLDSEWNDGMAYVHGTANFLWPGPDDQVFNVKIKGDEICFV
jgi:hypothetical protein